MRRSTKAGILLAENIEALKRGAELIERLDDQLYTRADPRLSLAAVGSHLRHCLDFYLSFLAGMVTGRVNYDARERDERIERDRSRAAARLGSIIESLSRLPLDERAGIEVLLEGSSAANDGWSPSSLQRELQFLLSHTIHHYALIALSLRLQGFDAGAGFGVAPSTLRSRRKAA